MDVGSPEQLKSIMETLINDTNRKKRIAEANLRKIAGYTVEEMAKAHIKVFESL